MPTAETRRRRRLRLLARFASIWFAMKETGPEPSSNAATSFISVIKIQNPSNICSSFIVVFLRNKCYSVEIMDYVCA